MLLLSLLASITGWAQPSSCPGSDPGGTPAGAGLYAEYYRGFFNTDFSFFTNNALAPVITRVEPEVNFTTNTSFGDLTAVATGPVNDPDNFSLRLRGSIIIPVAGQYTFFLTSDDASYLWLDGAAVALPANPAAATIDNGGFHAPEEVSRTVTLTAGPHSLLIHYGEADGDNTLILEYAGPGIARQPVPASMFCTATQMPRPPQSLAYFPTTLQAFVGSRRTSTAPTVADGGSAVTSYALVGPAVAGITIEPTTGVVSMADNTPLGTYNLEVAVTNAHGTSTFRNALTVDVIVGTPPGCSGLDPAGNSPTSGLYAEYFTGYFNNSPGFFSAAPGLSRTEPVIDFSGEDSFGSLTGVAGDGTANDPDEFSARMRAVCALAPRASTPSF
ncbi:PA14 domain-containing protein [Hymenobacter cellulosilyticus]|uniref:PA14 domain-containing protein n=1 Tax=Hymenobacter cellulosilyticus TaxID=2932248 RepID=A0A8T9Q7Y0_9BACT|nr:PA14 domain-containing protein [Hymenobacter cellulosilyticus]UOQ73614.1 PA14 domain-containing protein [Hymenobacter cellulosilyticus]